MSKLKHKIVLFIEPCYEYCEKLSEIGNLFINRFAIDESAGHEILKIYRLETKVRYFNTGQYGKYGTEWITAETGLDLINYWVIVRRDSLKLG